MLEEEREEIVELLREELRVFISWAMGELGGEYYLENPEEPISSWDKTALGRVEKRMESERVHMWERDRYAFFDHPKHPSIYNLMETEDLELAHYLEELYCEHYRIEDEVEGCSEEEIKEKKRFDDSFGVLLASQMKGWMYRLDFCDVCGLIEVWSMEYDPEEIAIYTEGP
jgi:hypothetical protein